MSLLDRLRGRWSDRPAGPAWDGDVTDDFVLHVAALAAAGDPDPDDPRVAASRAAALGAFAAATASASERVDDLPGAAGRALPPAGAAPGIRRGGRRPALVLVATGLLLAMSLGTVAASAPGGPLYDLRVASEELLLPAGPDDRSWAQVERLDGRLAEASGAAARGDVGAVLASLRAYARIATEAAFGRPTDSTTAAQLALRVRAQLEVIARIGPGDLTLEGVRTEAQVAARALLGALGEPGDGPGPGPAGTDAPTPGATPGASGSQAPEAPGGSGGPGPSASPNGPSLSPAPGGTGGLAASPGPTMTPSPSRTPGGSGSPGGGGNATPQPSGGPSPAGDGPASSSSPRGRP